MAAATAWLIMGQQAHHEAVVGGPDNGGVKFPVRLGSVLPQADAPVHVLSPGQDVRHLLLRGPEAGQPGGAGLKDGPQFKEVFSSPRT